MSRSGARHGVIVQIPCAQIRRTGHVLEPGQLRQRVRMAEVVKIGQRGSGQVADTFISPPHVAVNQRGSVPNWFDRPKGRGTSLAASRVTFWVRGRVRKRANALSDIRNATSFDLRGPYRYRSNVERVARARAATRRRMASSHSSRVPRCRKRARARRRKTKDQTLFP